MQHGHERPELMYGGKSRLNALVPGALLTHTVIMPPSALIKLSE